MAHEAPAGPKHDASNVAKRFEDVKVPKPTPRVSKQYTSEMPVQQDPKHGVEN
jgi:hypothetical protein